MKFLINDLPRLIKLIEKREIKALVLHGHNQGFIKTAIDQISQKLNYNIFNYHDKNLSINSLSLLVNRQNFFNEKELIRISNGITTINKEVKDFLITEEFFNFLCFTFEDSLPPTGIRKFFEEQPNLAVLSCYYDNEETISKIILQQSQKLSKNIEEDALFYLKTHLNGDHQIIKSELEKLFYYTHNKSVITKKDVIDSLSPELMASGDEMCIFFAKKNFLKFQNEIEKLKNQNINEVLMIRALIRYFLNMYIVSILIENGENIDRAIKTLSPPIFYKYINDFKQVIRQYNTDDITRVIKSLQQAEVDFKTNPASFDLFSLAIAKAL